jgi:hypothetical protein
MMLLGFACLGYSSYRKIAQGRLDRRLIHHPVNA